MAPSRGEEAQQALFPDMRKCERDKHIRRMISASETTIRGNMSADPVPAQVHLCKGRLPGDPIIVCQYFFSFINRKHCKVRYRVHT